MSSPERSDRFQLIISATARKELKKLPQGDIQRIVTRFDFITKSPFRSKKLSGELAAHYSLRVWPYRIIYKVDKQRRRVEINAIGHRQGIYK